MFYLYHLTVTANSLAEGVAFAEQALGVSMSAGGAHPLMGTHNRLLRLGETLFLEVIAPDHTSSPKRPRWFALDDPRTRAALAHTPRLLTWVVRTSDIQAALVTLPRCVGPAITLTRGDLEWLISVPSDGALPFDGAFPTLIEWPLGPHPASRLKDAGCSLLELHIRHPDAGEIQSLLEGSLDDPRLCFRADATPSLQALIQTPSGQKVLV